MCETRPSASDASQPTVSEQSGKTENARTRVTPRAFFPPRSRPGGLSGSSPLSESNSASNLESPFPARRFFPVVAFQWVDHAGLCVSKTKKQDGERGKREGDERTRSTQELHPTLSPSLRIAHARWVEFRAEQLVLALRILLDPPSARATRLPHSACRSLCAASRTTRPGRGLPAERLLDCVLSTRGSVSQASCRCRDLPGAEGCKEKDALDATGNACRRCLRRGRTTSLSRPVKGWKTYSYRIFWPNFKKNCWMRTGLTAEEPFAVFLPLDH
ncbi:hypothetical protein DFH11DRAFT_1730768 [Phellopilus nigrolimitatus]|nr:hypothetical protein DFH11DRAFT_1730768 [Phellopilus nigrolimitatus]